MQRQNQPIPTQKIPGRGWRQESACLQTLLGSVRSVDSTDPLSLPALAFSRFSFLTHGEVKFEDGFFVGYTLRGNSLDLTTKSGTGTICDHGHFPLLLSESLTPNTGTHQAARCPGVAFSVASTRP